MFEFAASYPREAEESLKASKSRYKSLLGIIVEAKPLIAQMGIKTEAAKNGYNYEITVPAELKALARKRANHLLSRFDCVDRDWFEYLANTEFYPTFDHEGNKAFSFPPDTEPHAGLTPSVSLRSGEAMEFSMYGELAKAFDCFLRVHRFL